MTRLVRWDPFTDLDELHQAFFGGQNLASSNAAPAADVYVNDNKELVGEFHLAGFEEQDVEVQVDEGRLEIRAKKETHNEDKKKYVVRESSQQFYRSVALPKNADEDKATADFENGILKVTVPFKELPKPKKIGIKKIATKTKK